MALFKIDIAESVRVKMAQVQGQINAEMAAKLDRAAGDLAQMVYTKWRELAFERLDKTAVDYADAVEFAEVAPGVYSVSLNPSAHWLEEGVDSFDMKPGLLAKNAKRSKAGFLYKVIPFQHRSSGQAKGSAGDMLSDLKRIRRALGDTGITKDNQGNPLLGKIWSATPDTTGAWNLRPGQTGVEPGRTRFVDPQPSRHLQGITKYQWEQKLRGGGSRVQSSFVTFRTVSSNPKYAHKWIYPNTKPGKQLMPEVYNWALTALNQILDEVFRT